MKIVLDENKELYLNGRRVDIKDSEYIRDYVVLNNYLYLTIFPKDKDFSKGNIFKLDDSGNIIWQSKPFIDPTIPGRVSHFIYIFEEQGQLTSYNSAGYDFKINEETGEVIKEKKEHRPW